MPPVVTACPALGTSGSPTASPSSGARPRSAPTLNLRPAPQASGSRDQSLGTGRTRPRPLGRLRRTHAAPRRRPPPQPRGRRPRRLGVGVRASARPQSAKANPLAGLKFAIPSERRTRLKQRALRAEVPRKRRRRLMQKLRLQSKPLGRRQSPTPCWRGDSDDRAPPRYLPARPDHRPRYGTSLGQRPGAQRGQRTTCNGPYALNLKSTGQKRRGPTTPPRTTTGGNQE